MFKKIIFISLIFLWIIFLLPHHVFANVVINEIMYDLPSGSDDGREWVEIYNDADTPVDISSYKFFEANANHKLTLVQGDANIAAYGYALIVSDPVKFKIDQPNFSGVTASSGTPPSAVAIFDSTFSLSNSGETLMIKNGDKEGNLIVYQYTYHSSSGGAGDGKSLQKINGVWLAAAPTPGAENKLPIAPPKPTSTPVSKKVSTATNPVPKITTPLRPEVGAPLLNQARLPDGQGGEGNSYIFIIILIFLLFLLGFGVGAVYFIRKKKSISATGDDFEILDK